MISRMLLNTHHHVVDRLRMNGDISPFPYAFILNHACERVYNIFYHFIIIIVIIDYSRGLNKVSKMLRTGKSGFRFRTEARIFLYSPKRPDWFWGPHSPLLKGCWILSWLLNGMCINSLSFGVMVKNNGRNTGGILYYYYYYYVGPVDQSV